MKLPSMRYSDSIKRSGQTGFSGYNHSAAAGDGELYDMENLTSLYYPLLSPRPKRMLCKTLFAPNGLCCRDELCWVDGTTFYYGGAARGSVSDGKKVFAALGVYIVIFPDKKFYNTLTGQLGSLEARYMSGPGRVTFTNGTLYDEEAECNTLCCPDVDWNYYFKAGDAVTIFGCTVHTENNKTPIIREVSSDGHSLHFYEYVFTLGGEDAVTPYTEPGAVTLARTVPDMDYLCANENRLWGCRDDTIYSSKLGDIFNWNVYDGLATDAYAVSVGSAGSFTGCVSYLGYPVFFKPENIYKVYGAMPSNFQVMGSATLGVAEGSSASLAIAGETLFYLSRSGVIAYTGGVPTPIGAAFGTDRYHNAVAGSDGLRYYVSMENEAGQAQLFVYDTTRGLWHREDATKAVSFAFTDNLYMLTDKGALWLTGSIANPPEGAAEEKDVHWMAEFGDFTDASPTKKGVSKLLLRLELDTAARLNILMRYDSTGEFERVASLTASVKRSYVLPVVPRRADHYRIRLEGTGGCRLYGLAHEYYSGRN